jgi:hypothetical protein
MPLQVNASFAAVGATWELVRARSPLVAPALAAVRASADAALRHPAASVMNKTSLPPSGDKHDYESIGVYWWPCSRVGPPACACNATHCDTTTPTCDVATGLPWLSCDGHANHAAMAAGDQPAIAALAADVKALANGFYWTRNETYAARAAALVRTWFLAPATRMNPNLNFGQRFPGIAGDNNGTFSGLIETDGNFLDVLDGVALLGVTAPCGAGGAACAGSAAWAPADDAALADWLRAWAEWLAASPFSATALAMYNNHQTWLRGAFFAVSAWLGDTARGVALLDGAKGGGPRPSICGQVGAGGALPAEEDRVNSVGYVEMDLRGLLNLGAASRFAPFVAAGGAAQTGDLYDFVCDNANHSSVRAAVDYMIPFATGARAWPFPTETVDFTGAAPLFRQAAVVWRNETYAQVADAIVNASAADASVLWWRA